MNKQVNHNKRMFSLDALKLFSMFLVIWGHSIQSFSSIPSSEVAIYRYIYSFHMPLFMMISGYFSCSSMRLNPRKFVSKKFMQLIYPCFTFGLIGWLFLESVFGFKWGCNEINPKGLLTDFFWIADFWFLKSCFSCYCLLYIGMNSRIKQPYGIVLTLLVSQFIIPYQVSFLYPCFILGAGLHNSKPFIKLVVSYRWQLTVSFVAMLIFWNDDIWQNSHGYPFQNTEINTLKLVQFAFFRFYRLSIGIIGALTFISIFVGTFHSDSQNRITQQIGYWGKFTLEMYLIQAALFEWFVKIIGFQIAPVGKLIPFSLFFAIATLFFCIITVKVIQQSRCLYKFLFAKEI